MCFTSWRLSVLWLCKVVLRPKIWTFSNNAKHTDRNDIVIKVFVAVLLMHTTLSNPGFVEGDQKLFLQCCPLSKVSNCRLSSCILTVKYAFSNFFLYLFFKNFNLGLYRYITTHFLFLHTKNLGNFTNAIFQPNPIFQRTILATPPPNCMKSLKENKLDGGMSLQRPLGSANVCYLALPGEGAESEACLEHYELQPLTSKKCYFLLLCTFGFIMYLLTKKRSLFRQEDHIISRIFYSRDNYLSWNMILSTPFRKILRVTDIPVASNTVK